MDFNRQGSACADSNSRTIVQDMHRSVLCCRYVHIHVFTHVMQPHLRTVVLEPSHPRPRILRRVEHMVANPTAV